jgi:Undecaprenyl-phosphate glucose phosphotransferase
LDSDLDLEFDIPLEQQAQQRRRARRRLRINSSWSGDIVAGALVVLDFAAVMLAGLVAHVVTIGERTDLFDKHVSASVLCAITVLQSNAMLHLYDATLANQTLRLVDRVLTALFAAFGFLALIAYLTESPVAYPSLWKVAIFGFSFAFVAGGRLLFNRTVAGLGKRNLVSRNVVIVGAGEQGKQLVAQLERSACPWTRILGAYDDRAHSRRVPERLGRYPVRGTTQDLVALSRRFRVDEIFIALPLTAEARIAAVLHSLNVIPANIHLCPDILRQSALNRTLTSLDGMPVVTMVGKPVAGWGYLLKWILDKALALLGLIALSPLFMLVAIAIKLESRGPVFFRQPRLGFNNRLIEIYKFRSMYHQQRDLAGENLTTRGDPRVTALGRILRKLSIDELPQLINVLLGDMSLVGPRPHALKAKAAGQLYPEIVAGYALRHKIKPGITGWAQVNGWRGETDTEEKIIRRVEFDLYYMNHWSLLFDLYILAMTLVKAPFHRNAY